MPATARFQPLAGAGASVPLVGDLGRGLTIAGGLLLLGGGILVAGALRRGSLRGG